jgi:hypothetical protein
VAGFSPIEDQQLLLEEHRFGDQRTGAAGTRKSDDCRQQMKNEDGQVRTGQSYQGRTVRKCPSLSNSPWTAAQDVPSYRASPFLRRHDQFQPLNRPPVVIGLQEGRCWWPSLCVTD